MYLYFQMPTKADPDQKGKQQHTVCKNSQYFKRLIICNSQSCLKVTCLLCLASTVVNRENTVNCTTREKIPFVSWRLFWHQAWLHKHDWLLPWRDRKKSLWQKNVWVSSLLLKCTGENSFKCISGHKWG